MKIPFDDERTENIVSLKVPFKKPVSEDKFLVVEHATCAHFGPFSINEHATAVVCKKCGEKLNPMYVLKLLTNKETRWHESFRRYEDNLKVINERNRTKCEHCKQMTRIVK